MKHLEGVHKDILSHNESSEDENEKFVESPKNPRKNLQNQDHISNLFIDFVASNVQALSIANDKKFLKFVFTLNPRYFIPERKALRDKISYIFSKQFTKVKEEFASLGSKINLSTDLWTSTDGEPYLSLRAYYFTNNWELKSILLDVMFSEAIEEVVFFNWTNLLYKFKYLFLIRLLNIIL